MTAWVTAATVTAPALVAPVLLAAELSGDRHFPLGMDMNSAAGQKRKQAGEASAKQEKARLANPPVFRP